MAKRLLSYGFVALFATAMIVGCGKKQEAPAAARAAAPAQTTPIEGNWVLVQNQADLSTENEPTDVAAGNEDYFAFAGNKFTEYGSDHKIIRSGTFKYSKEAVELTYQDEEGNTVIKIYPILSEKDGKVKIKDTSDGIEVGYVYAKVQDNAAFLESVKKANPAKEEAAPPAVEPAPAPTEEKGKPAEPKKEEPKKEEPKKEEPKKEEPKKEAPKEEPKKEEPKKEEPKKEEAKPEAPKEEPKKEEPKKEEAKPEAPKEEPKKEEPKPEAPKEAPKA